MGTGIYKTFVRCEVFLVIKFKSFLCHKSKVCVCGRVAYTSHRKNVTEYSVMIFSKHNYFMDHQNSKVK